MTVSVGTSSPSDEEIAIAQRVIQLWNQSAQTEATDALRPLADAGSPWATSLIGLLLAQQDLPQLRESVAYAKTAAANGMPWAAAHVFVNILSRLPNAPDLIDDAVDLAAWSTPSAGEVDPLGQGWNLCHQGRYAEGIRLMRVTARLPLSPDEWDQLLSAARTRTSELDSVVEAAHEQLRTLKDVATSSRESIEKSRSDLETKAKQAGVLVSTVGSDTTNSLFKAEASRNQDESRKSWRWGLGVLVAAALVAVLPLLLHYFGEGPDYSTPALVGAHIASTLALATVAGVILARARLRDQAAQRAHDLSTAMGTVITYSNQISDPAEKERFTMTLVQLVLQAHLTTAGSTHTNEDSLAGVIALASLIGRGPSAGA